MPQSLTLPYTSAASRCHLPLSRQEESPSPPCAQSATAAQPPPPPSQFSSPMRESRAGERAVSVSGRHSVHGRSHMQRAYHGSAVATPSAQAAKARAVRKWRSWRWRRARGP